MMIIGGNILDIALAAIGTQTVVWRQFKARTQNDRGAWINEYEDDEGISGSWQPVPVERLKELELDTSKDHHVLFTSNPVDIVNRGEAPDLLVYGGRMYEVIFKDDWTDQNGWSEVIGVYVGDDDEPTEP